MARRPAIELLHLLLLFATSFSLIHGDSMRSSQSNVASSLQDPKYKIDFHPPESPVLPTSEQETIVMTDRDGKKFRCNLPVLEGLKVVDEDEIEYNGTNTSLVADERSSRKTPEDLLDVLKDKCFRRYEGWWIYELCYKGHLRQFHLHDKKIVQEFVLGTYDAEVTAALHENSPNVSLQKDPRSQNAAQRYHAHVYTNGTICDLTNQPRETEVRFVCSESGRALINSIKEAPTCKYTLVFHAPMLCKHPAFQEERQPWVVIDCNALPAEEVPVKEAKPVDEEKGSALKALVLTSEASTTSVESSKDTTFVESSKDIKEVTEVSENTKEPTSVEEPASAEGEAKVEEAGHEREEHPAA